jgi:hypothetical protein
VVNEVANVIRAPDGISTKDCYGWDLMLDADDDNSDPDRDFEIPDNVQGEQFAHPNHNNANKDFMGLEDTLNDVL